MLHNVLIIYKCIILKIPIDISYLATKINILMKR